MKRIISFAAIVLVLGAAAISNADTVILNETFQSYADSTAMQAAWPTANTANSRLAGNAEQPLALAPGELAAEHLGGPTNKWTGLTSTNALHPTATQSVRIEADIYEDAASANKRMSLGLRGPAVNIIEMGSWNANTCDPTVSGCVPGTTGVGGPGFIAANGRALAARLVNFVSPVQSPLLVQPNWQYYDLPVELDANANGVVAVAEVHAAWNHYVATITPTTVTLSIDLYRDGLKNTAATAGTGTPGLDAEKIWNVTSDAAGYSDLRFGGPSDVASTGGGLLFDNIKLSLIDVVAPGLAGDFNNDGKVDAGDYAIWRKNDTANAVLPNDNSVGTQAGRFSLWRANFGKPPGAGSGLSGGAVPEPTSIVLLLSSLGFVFAGRRRTR